MAANPIKAIPTVYRGVQFRSRLEAKWAAFFDLQRWEWQYEPFDLNGWIPDFLLKPATLVEVKPITRFDPDVAEEMQGAGAPPDIRVLWLVGCSIDSNRVGWSRATDDPPGHWMNTYLYLQPTRENGEMILEPERIGEAAGYQVARGPESCLSAMATIHMASLRSLDRKLGRDDEQLRSAFSLSLTLDWAKAGNLVQWKPPC